MFPGKYFARLFFSEKYWPGGGVSVPDIFAAIRNRFRATDALVDSVPGGLWFQVAPQRTTMPFVVLVEDREVDDFTTSGTYVESVTVEFRIHAQTAEEAKRLKRLWTRPPHGFDRCVLQVSSGAFMGCERQRGKLKREDERTIGGVDVWVQSLEYLITVSR